MPARLLRTIAVTALVLVPAAGCGSGGSSGGGGTPDTGLGADLEVHAKDSLKFDKKSYTATAGDIDVVYKNDGSTAHNLLIEDVDDFKLTVGKTDEGTVTLKAGTYTLYCDLAGHEQAGMKATLKVT
jgi:plastocyanin